MAKYQPDTLARTFSALVDPTRRAILARLANETEASISALAEPLPIKLPAVMKHLDVLADAHRPSVHALVLTTGTADSPTQVISA